jgi:myo-inositol-1(or 4)-monophosphatase
MSSVELTAEDLQSILTFTVSLARKAGELIRQGSLAIQKAGSDVNEKKNSVDLVTEYDLAVEELVKKEIGEKYPAFKLYVPSRSKIAISLEYCTVLIDDDL